MTTPLDNLMPIGATLHPHTSQNFFKIGPGGATTITAPPGALTVAVTWEGEENLYLWAERDGKPIRVIAQDRTGGANTRRGRLAHLMRAQSIRRQPLPRRHSTTRHNPHRTHAHKIKTVAVV